MKNTVIRPVYLFLFLILVFTVAAQADTELKFEKAVYYGDSGNQVGNAVKFTPGHLYVAGSDTSSKTQSLIVNYAVPPSELPLSDFRWPDEQKSAISVSTAFSDLAVSSEGLYGAGSSLATMSGKKKTTQLLGVLAKFPLDKSDAKPLWAAYSAYSEEFKEEVFRAVATTTEPNSTVIYVTGHAVMGENNLTAVLAKYDASGKLLWSELIGDKDLLKKSGGTALAVSGGYVYVAGFSNSNDDKKRNFNSLALNPTLWKYDSSGNKIWMKTSSAKLHGFSTSNQDNLTHGIKVGLVISDNYVYLTSGKAGTNKDPGDFLFSKYDLDGKLIWETAWAAKLSDEVVMKNAWALGIAAAKDRIYVSGYGEYKDKGKKTYGRGSDSFLIEADKDYGSVLAVHSHGASGYSENAFDMAMAGTDVYVAGLKNTPADPDKKNSSDNLDLALLRYSALPVTQVAIDIEPGVSQNKIILKDEAPAEDASEKKNKKDKPEVKKITVAVLSTKEFKAASQVDLKSLTFGRTGNEASWDSCNVKDINEDGIADLLCYFKISWNVWEGSDPESPAFIFENGDKEGVLKGMTLSGTRFMGKDVVRVGESDSPAPQPAPEPVPPAPAPAPEPTPPLVSEPPAPTPLPEPTPVVSQPPVPTEPQPAPVSPVPSESSTPTPAPESTLPLGSDTSTVPEPTPTSAEIVQQPSVSGSSVLPDAPVTTETSSTSTSSQTESLAPIVHATIVTQPTTTQTTKLQPIAFVSQPVITNQPTATSTASAPSKTAQSSTSSGSSGTAATSSTSNLQAILSSRSGETQHANGIFSSGTDSSEGETSDSEAPALTKSLKSEGDGSKSGSGLGRAYGDMGKKAFQEGNFSEAITNYTEALKLDPDSPELHTDFGLVLVHEGRLEEARDHFSEALKLNPDDQVARENLNLVMAKLGKSTTEPTPVVTAPSVTVSK